MTKLYNSLTLKTLKADTVLFNIVKWFCLLAYLTSSYCWIIEYVPPQRYVFLIFDGLLVLLLIVKNVIFIDKLRFSQYVFVLVCFAIWTSYTTKSSLGGLEPALVYMPAILLYYLPFADKNKLLEFITKAFSIIIAISIGLYLLNFIVNVPYFNVYKIDNDDFYPQYLNYIFYIKSDRIQDFLRFNGPFREPGHLAIIVSFLLYANKFDFRKKSTIVLFISLILSFSLAGWVMFGVGYIIQKAYNIKKTILVIAALSIFVFIGQSYNDGENYVNNLILERLEYDQDKGIKGNNRFLPSTDVYYSELVKNGEIWIGNANGANRRKAEGAGYKIYFVRQGAFSAIFVLILYLLMIPPSANKRYAVGFLVIVILCFIQRAYPFWFSWILPFVLGNGINKRPICKNNVLATCN